MEFSISKMAEMHGISRQTLIYYDKIGLFHPTWVDEKGTRYYDSSQMPFLREICFLKEQGIPLKHIQKDMESRNAESAMMLLESQIRQIEKKQQELERTKQMLLNRVQIYENALKEKNCGEPVFIEYYPMRRALFVPWQEEMDEGLLHMCYVKGRERLSREGLSMERGFGAIVRREYLHGSQPMKGAGSLFFLPDDAPGVKGEIIIPGGDYLCMYSCGMPYRLGPLYEFLEQIDDSLDATEGDVISVCLLDTTFHNEQMKEDFCLMQLLLK